MNIGIKLDPENRNSINITWPAWPTNIFTLWTPEVWCLDNDADRLWVRDQLPWRKVGRVIRAADCVWAHRKYRFTSSMKVEAGACEAKLSVTVVNTGDVSLPAAFNINGCLNFLMAPDFMDSTGCFTFFRTRAGWHSLEKLRHPQAAMPGHDPVHILLEGCDDPGNPMLVRKLRTVSSLCLRQGRFRRHCVGIAWERPYTLHFNFNRLHCMHSAPRLGPLAPRETVTVRGRIFFIEGSKDKMWKIVRNAGML